MSLLGTGTQRSIVRSLDEPGTLNVTIPYTPHDAKGKGGPYEFHQDRYVYPYRAVFAGTGGGKTLCTVFDVLMWGLQNPNAQIGEWEPTYPMVRNILWPTWRKLIGGFNSSPLVSHWRKGEKTLELVTGATYYFGSMEDPEANEGPNLDLGHLDEARIVTHLAGEDGALNVITRRLRGSEKGMKIGFIVSSSAPKKALHLFFENPRTRMPGSKVYRWSSLDNPHLPQSYETIIARYTGASKERMVEGRFALAEGLVYSEYRPEKHLRPPPDRRIWKRVTYGVDWGFTHNAAVIAVVWTGNIAHVIDEWVHAGRGDDEIHQALWDMKKRYGDGPTYAGADRPEAIAFLGKPLHDKTGKMKAPPHRFVDKYVGRVEDRIDVINSRLKAGELTIDKDRCPHIQEEIEDHGRKPNGEPEDEGNDALDGMAYGVVGGSRLVERSGTW